MMDPMSRLSTIARQSSSGRVESVGGFSLWLAMVTVVQCEGFDANIVSFQCWISNGAVWSLKSSYVLAEIHSCEDRLVS